MLTVGHVKQGSVSCNVCYNGSTKNCEKKYLKMSPMVLFRANRNRQKKNVSERNMIKYLNWQKANQLAMYKSG